MTRDQPKADAGWLGGLTSLLDGTVCSGESCAEVCNGQSQKPQGEFFSATRPPQRQHLAAYSMPVDGPEGSVGILWNVEELDFWGPSLVVVECVAGGAAEGKGIVPGDILYSIDGSTLASKNADDMVKLLQGASGTSVCLQFEPAGQHMAGIKPDRRILKTVHLLRRSAVPRSRAGSVSASPEGARQQMRVLDTYTPSDMSDHPGSVILALREGDTCWLLAKGNRGWSTVETHDGRIGWFPAAFLNPVDGPLR